MDSEKANHLEVEYMNVSELKMYHNNAKIHDDEQIDAIARSIERFGMNDPIGIWKNDDGVFEIVEGHGRVLAAGVLGIEEVPVIRLDHLTDEERRAYTHIHNQTTLISDFDEDILAIDMNELDFDWEDFGFIAEDDADDGERRDVDIDETLGVFVECDNESEQQNTFDKLLGEGFKCRILTL